MVGQIDESNEPQRADALLTFARQELTSTLDALRELLRQITPHVEVLDSPDTFTKMLDSEYAQLAEGERIEFKRALRSTAQILRIAASEADRQTPPEASLDSNAAEDDSRERAAVPDACGPDGTPPPQSGPDTEVGHSVAVTSVPVARALLAVMKSMVAPRKLPILHRSLVTMAVAAFEVLVGHTVRSCLRLNPGILHTDSKEFSLEDLQAFASVADAVDELVVRRVDDLMMGGFESWTKWFIDGPLKLDLAQLALDWDQTRELFQRRHVIVHNGGSVSRLYLQRTPTSELPEPPPTVGTVLEVDADYVLRTIDLLFVLGVELTGMVRLKLIPNVAKEEGIGYLSQYVYDLLLQRRWRAAGALAEMAETLGRKHGVDANIVLRSTCNKWLCAKRERGLEAVRSEIEAWDTSAMAPVFQLVKAVLLERMDEAYEVLPSALDSKDPSQHDLAEWPILEELRADPRFLGFSVKPSDPSADALPDT